MIKINLLPYHEAKKKAGKAKEIILVLGAVLIFAALLFSYHSYMVTELVKLNRSIGENQKKIKDLDEVVGSIEEFKESKLILENKIDVIKRLEEGREFPVFMFKQLAGVIPEKDLSLNSVSQMGNMLSLDGIARNPTTVALFMKSLESLPFIVSVDLQSSKQEEASGGEKIQVFKISCAIKKG
ncbi:MAG: PilN domain-containing protein [Syntrophobacterales bacterium]|jgi:type IV pilus assembly protein PilN|nr:PilN domain-containing protein [Syntrophobacterales bacterium]